MDVETEHEDSEVRDDTQGETFEDPSTEDSSHITVNGNDEGGVPAEVDLSHHEEEKHPAEAATSEPEDNSRDEPPVVDGISTSKDLDVSLKVNEQLVSHEESVVFEINSHDDDGHPRLHLDTPDRERASAAEEEDKEEEEEEEDRLIVASAENEDISKECMQVLQQLCEERDKASQHSIQLQKKLTEYLCKKSRTDTQLQWEGPVSEQMHEYEKCMTMLTEVKQQLTSDLEAAQQREEELRAQSQEKVDKVELEWREFVALKRHVAGTVLSHSLGKQAAQAKVESTLAEEQLWQDKLAQLRLKHIKSKMKIHRLEEELRDEEERSRDPLQLQFEHLLAVRLEQRRQAEKQSEESSKLQNKIKINLEVLSNVKEKLFWNQMQVKSKREQLSELEATVARKRDLLTRTKQARNGLQKDNLRLKECQGLLGNRVLLQDFENTVDASAQLEEHLEDLKCRQAEMAFSCGRWKKKLDTR